MSKAHPRTCEHCGEELSMHEYEGQFYCDTCGRCVAVVCPLCGGEGFMKENEMESDWVHYGNDLVTCKACDGFGWTADPSFQ